MGYAATLSDAASRRARHTRIRNYLHSLRSIEALGPQPSQPLSNCLNAKCKVEILLTLSKTSTRISSQNKSENSFCCQSRSNQVPHTNASELMLIARTA